MLFEVTTPVPVVNEHNEPFGTLSPGVQYEAVASDDHWVTLAGPNDSLGYVERSSVRLIAAPNQVASVPTEAHVSPTPTRVIAPRPTTHAWSPGGLAVEPPSPNLSERRRRKQLATLWDTVYGTCHSVQGNAHDAVVDAALSSHLPYTGDIGYLDIQLHDASIHGHLPADRTPAAAMFSVFYDQARGAPYFLRYDHLSIGAVVELEPDLEWRQELSDLSADAWTLRVVASTASVYEALALFRRLEQASGRGGLTEAAYISVVGPSHPRYYNLILDLPPYDAVHEQWTNMWSAHESLPKTRGSGRPISLAAWGEVSVTDW